MRPEVKNGVIFSVVTELEKYSFLLHTHGFKILHFTSCMLCIIIFLTRRDTSGCALVPIVSAPWRYRQPFPVEPESCIIYIRYKLDVHFGSLYRRERGIFAASNVCSYNCEQSELSGVF